MLNLTKIQQRPNEDLIELFERGVVMVLSLDRRTVKTVAEGQATLESVANLEVLKGKGE